jgi:DNA-directed RNA polymerase specialized sigma24 family protein
MMHYVHGLPYEAMADLLDVSVSALKMRVLRAREHLQLALNDHGVTDRAASRLARRGARLAPRRLRRE